MTTSGSPFDTVKSFCPDSQCSHLTKCFDIFPSEGGCSEDLDAFRFFLNGFGPFSFKFFVLVKVGLSTKFSLNRENE